MDLTLFLCLVTDRKLCGGRRLEEVVEEAVLGGVTVVQLREKEASSREFYDIARGLKTLLDAHGVGLIIKDRLDIALAVRAAGVHLGQHDLPCIEARRIAGKQMIIGLSVETVEQARNAEGLEVDYLGVGPIFPTPTKTDAAKPIGLAGLQEVHRHSQHKLVAIGGINFSNAQAVREAGADGIAVVSAICAAANPRAAAMELRKI